jgi:rubrerythrin
MPGFGTPFSVLANNVHLTHAELIRAIRFLIASEYEAVQMYTQLAESTDNKIAIEVLREIADEERVHAGEFLRLLHELSPDEAKLYDQGAKEVEELIRGSVEIVQPDSAYIRTSADDPSPHAR